MRMLQFLSSSLPGESGEKSRKNKEFQIEMHLRLTLPSGEGCLPAVLHSCFEFGYLFLEASSSPLQRVSFSPERSSVRETSVG